MAVVRVERDHVIAEPDEHDHVRRALNVGIDREVKREGLEALRRKHLYEVPRVTGAINAVLAIRKPTLSFFERHTPKERRCENILR